MHISKETLNKLRKILALETGGLRLNKFALPVRFQMVREAISWPKGKSQTNRETHKIYTIENNFIGVEKPGKEAAPNYKNCTDFLTKAKTNNPNDMLPVLYVNELKHEESFSFNDIFHGIELQMRADTIALEVLGMVLFRMAYTLDHNKNNKGNYRLMLKPFITDFLRQRIPIILGIPIEEYIYYLEVLALNEDVKYFTLHNNPELNKDTGRANTLLTLVNLIAVLLNRKSVADFAGSFARPPIGISAIQKTKIADYFPLFATEFKLK